MRISKKTEYALRVMLLLANNPGQLLSVSEISSRQGIPMKFLEQIMGSLKAGSLLTSERGNKGGYRLAKTPLEITLFDIVKTFEGPSILDHSDAFGSSNGHLDSSGTVLKEALSDLNNQLKDNMQKVSLEELHRKEKDLTSTVSINFSI